MVEDLNPTPGTDEAVAVAITAPAPGQAVSNLVEISASAIAAGGAVTGVEFFLPDGLSVIDRIEPFSTTWNTTTVPDGSYVVRAIATSAAGTINATETPIVVANAGAAPCPSETSHAQSLPRAIPDYDLDGIKSAIQVPGSGKVTSLLLSLDITHEFPPELSILLTSPSGEIFDYHPSQTGSSTRVVLDRLAIPSFHGHAAAGAWTLNVIDGGTGDRGNLNAWSLTLTRACTH